MIDTRRIRAAALALLMAALLIPLPARAAASYSDLQKQLEQAQKQQKALQSQIAGNKASQTQVKQQIAVLEQANGILAQQIGQLNAQAADCAQQISATDRKIADTQGSIDADTKLYKERVTAMFETGRVSYLELLLSSKTPAQFLARYEIITLIQQHDTDLIARLKSEKNAVVSQRAALAAQQSSLKASQGTYEAKQAELNRQSSQRTSLYAQLKGQQASLAAQNKQMEQTEAAVREQMRKALAAASAAGAHGTGVLIWPVSGPITCPFGWRTNPYTGATGDFHDGIDIGAGLGTPIRAADSGVVKYDIPGLAANNMQAVYGSNYLFILHGNGMITFYGHCSGRAAANGAQVAKGQVVAYVGSEGYSTGPHLHFGVYINGQAVNPTKYL